MILAVVAALITSDTATYVPFLLRDLEITSSAQMSVALIAKTAAIAPVAVMFGFARKYISSDTDLIFSFAVYAVGSLLITGAGTFAAVTAA